MTLWPQETIILTKKYTDEAYGQKEFYADYLPLIDKDLSFDEIKQDNSDGILNGNILEFKLITQLSQ